VQESSPCIDAAGPLTTITSADGSGTSFQVESAATFVDGWGIIEPDQIQLEGQAEAVTLAAVDYDTETLTVDHTVDWTQGQGVSLIYAGDAPDLGAYEHGLATTCTDLGGTCCLPDEQCVGGDYEEALDCGSRCCLGGTCEPSPGTGGTGGSGGQPVPDGHSQPGTDDGGCGCRVQGRPAGQSTLAWWMVGLVLARWRRRSRSDDLACGSRVRGSTIAP